MHLAQHIHRFTNASSITLHFPTKHHGFISQKRTIFSIRYSTTVHVQHQLNSALKFHVIPFPEFLEQTTMHAHDTAMVVYNNRHVNTLHKTM